MKEPTQTKVRNLIYEMLSVWVDWQLQDDEKDARLTSCMAQIRYEIDTYFAKEEI